MIHCLVIPRTLSWTREPLTRRDLPNALPLPQLSLGWSTGDPMSLYALDSTASRVQGPTSIPR